MPSIPQLNTQIKRLFEQEAVELAHQAGLRQRTIPLSKLVVLFVFGWWHLPRSGPSALARFAGLLDLELTKQEVQWHLTERTAVWLLALLRRAVQEVIGVACVSESWMHPFAAVFVEDGSTISLPSSLAHLWRGCGGSASTSKPESGKAALKSTVRFDLKGGGLHGPHLQNGRGHELAGVLSQQHMPKGSLWLADLGYWSLTHLSGLMKQGVYFCMRLKVGAVLWQEQKRTDIVSLLAALPCEQSQAEWRVDVGADKQLKAVRLLAQRVPAEVAQQRQQRIRDDACKHSKPVNPVVLDLAHWTLVISNVPASWLSLAQVLVVMRARWQVELLFKLWKEQGLVDEWTRTTHRWRILCEVYAKLLALVVQHWLMLAACWDDPHHSLRGVAELLREQVPMLAHGLCGHIRLGKALRLMIESVRGGCSIPARSTRLSTSRLIQSAFDNS